MTINETVKRFNSIFDMNRSEGQTKANFGVGLTSDIGQLKQAGNGVTVLGSTRCDSWDVARELLSRLRNEGFHVEPELAEQKAFQIFVYLYVKDSK